MDNEQDHFHLPGHVMDRSAVWKGRIEETPSDLEYWQQQPYELRLAALESIRQEYHGWHDDAQPRLQRVCQITEQT